MKTIVDKYSTGIRVVGAALLLGLAVLVGKAEANESESLDLLAQDLAQLHLEIYKDWNCACATVNRASDPAQFSYNSVVENFIRERDKFKCSDKNDAVVGTLTKKALSAILTEIQNDIRFRRGSQSVGALEALVTLLKENQ